MVDKEEKNLSPEEKLLRVIQSPPDTNPATAKKAESGTLRSDTRGKSAESVSEISSTPAPTIQVQAEQSGKSASISADLKEHEEQKTKVTSAGIAVPSQTVSKPSYRLKSATIAAIVLLMIIVVSMGMTGYEIWTHAKKDTGKMSLSPEETDSSTGRGSEAGRDEENVFDLQMQVPYSIEQVTEAYSKRSPFAEQKVSTVANVTQPVIDWIESARNNLRLIGISAVPGEITKAVLMNKTNEQIRIVKVGDEIQLDQKSVIVKQISNDYVILTDGKREHTIK